jgi:hypothetical protein
MFDQTGFLNGLSMIPLIAKAKTRSINAENPTGAKGSAAQEIPTPENAAAMLGKGWKVRPCIDLPAGSTTELAAIAGPGVIQHIWITADAACYRNCILRMYWDGEQTPSVETPLGDFFVHGSTHRHTVTSQPIIVNPSGGFNSYWPMPFGSQARITIENQGNKTVGGFFYQITYALTEIPAQAARFHAQWRRAVTPIDSPEHIIVDGIRGVGHYVGTVLTWTQLANGWWGEGEVKFFLDGDTEAPTICGTGTEDYFGGAWCFYDANGKEQTFSTDYLGLPYVGHQDNTVPVYDLYRWHIMDPIRFTEDLKVTIQALGWWPNGKFQPLQDDIASVAYWYQQEPHAEFPSILPVHLRWPR